MQFHKRPAESGVNNTIKEDDGEGNMLVHVSALGLVPGLFQEKDRAVRMWMIRPREAYAHVLSAIDLLAESHPMSTTQLNKANRSVNG